MWLHICFESYLACLNVGCLHCSMFPVWSKPIVSGWEQVDPSSLLLLLLQRKEVHLVTLLAMTHTEMLARGRRSKLGIGFRTRSCQPRHLRRVLKWVWIRTAKFDARPSLPDRRDARCDGTRRNVWRFFVYKTISHSLLLLLLWSLFFTLTNFHKIFSTFEHETPLPFNWKKEEEEEKALESVTYFHGRWLIIFSQKRERRRKYDEGGKQDR